MAEGKKPPEPLSRQLQKLTQGLVESEGWRRLSVAAGLIPAFSLSCYLALLHFSRSIVVVDAWWHPATTARKMVGNSGARAARSSTRYHQSIAGKYCRSNRCVYHSLGSHPVDRVGR
jgi:hypothetical protein